MASPNAAAVREALSSAIHTYEAGSSRWIVGSAKRSQKKADLIKAITEIVLQHRLQVAKEVKLYEMHVRVFSSAISPPVMPYPLRGGRSQDPPVGLTGPSTVGGDFLSSAGQAIQPPERANCQQVVANDAPDHDLR
ncbi:hypothetical protein BD769DRAFT_1386707 [Suillus cothurnatus]|nr:hypothetical protein BD769DRAFT_1386707 [Suillus cothurnatus]